MARSGRYGTYYWALDYFKKTLPYEKADSYATIVADANRSIDVIYDPIKYWYNPKAQSWHFKTNFGALPGSQQDTRQIHYQNSMKDAYDSLKKASETSGRDRDTYIRFALQSMGRGLHAKQDIISHSGFGGNINLGIFSFHAPGKDTLTPDNIRLAKDETEAVLKIFIGWGREFNLW